MTATARQTSYIASLARRDWWTAAPLLQAAYDNSAYGAQYPQTLSKSSGLKWLARAIDTSAASELIDELQEVV